MLITSLAPPPQARAQGTNLTQTTPTSTANPSDYGQVVVLTATVVNMSGSATPAGATMLAAALPSARSIRSGRTATAFATLINTSTSTDTGCSPAAPPGFPGTVSYQATNASNVPIGSADAPLDIAPRAAQDFVPAITPPPPIAGTSVNNINGADVGIVLDCANRPEATTVTGLDTPLQSASAAASLDIIAIGSTPSRDGIASTPGASGTALFAAAVISIRAAGAITATVDDGGRSLQFGLTLCEANPSTGACINPRQARRAMARENPGTPGSRRSDGYTILSSSTT